MFVVDIMYILLCIMYFVYVVNIIKYYMYNIQG